MIHKRSFPPHEGLPLGVWSVPGFARTIGLDGDGNIAVWYETNKLGVHDFQILWTGQQLEGGYTLIDTFTLSGLVWHLAVPMHVARRQ